MGNPGREAVSTDAAPAAIGPYSQAIRASGWLFCSGQIPLDPASGRLVPGGVAEQTVRVLDNLSGVLAAAGLGLGDVVKTTVFLLSMDDFPAMNEVYQHHFTEVPPARSTVAVAALPKGAQVEIEAIARFPVDG
ncbi:MAG: RidA family protein [Actinomycetota bacterium]